MKNAVFWDVTLCRPCMNIPSKRRFTQALHSATSQNTAFYIVTAAKTSNLTNIEIMFRKYVTDQNYIQNIVILYGMQGR
jgi:hypothetical protein